MTPHLPRRCLLPVLMAAWVALAGGCQRVHSRQWGYPNGLRRVGKPRPPQVNLRFEASPPSTAGATPSNVPPG